MSVIMVDRFAFNARIFDTSADNIAHLQGFKLFLEQR